MERLGIDMGTPMGAQRPTHTLSRSGLIPLVMGKILMGLYMVVTGEGSYVGMYIIFYH